MNLSSALVHLRRGSLFLVVGGVAFVIDAAVYNILVFWAGDGPFHQLPLVAKVISIAIGSVATYFGNQLLTFRDRKTRLSLRKFVIFVILNVIATILQLACLGFSRYVLHLNSPLADNVSGTLIGQAVATIFRYLTYGRYVFTADGAKPTPERALGNS